jgi:hypothetical protein
LEGKKMDNDLELVTLEEPPQLQEKFQPIFAAAVTNSPGISCVQRLPTLFPEEQMDELKESLLEESKSEYLDDVRLSVPCHCEAAIAAEAISLRV